MEDVAFQGCAQSLLNRLYKVTNIGQTQIYPKLHKFKVQS